MTPYLHARSSARKWGGTYNDYLDIHEWFDSSKLVIPDHRHRSLYHHTLGIEQARLIFGPVRMIKTKTGKTRDVPVKLIGEQHVIEDLGFLPTPMHYVEDMTLKKWMSGTVMREINVAQVLRDKESEYDF